MQQGIERRAKNIDVTALLALPERSAQDLFTFFPGELIEKGVEACNRVGFGQYQVNRHIDMQLMKYVVQASPHVFGDFLQTLVVLVKQSVDWQCYQHPAEWMRAVAASQQLQ
ncbi:hypothetical protein JOE28_001566 [Pseudomonas sp. PvP007]|nr:hypothetical protein [Pseudomonas sp. PvP007]MBP1122394.1 hypothetical protein [Pseudomonas sp. PvP028]